MKIVALLAQDQPQDFLLLTHQLARFANQLPQVLSSVSVILQGPQFLADGFRPSRITADSIHSLPSVTAKAEFEVLMAVAAHLTADEPLPPQLAVVLLIQWEFGQRRGLPRMRVSFGVLHCVRVVADLTQLPQPHFQPCCLRYSRANFSMSFVWRGSSFKCSCARRWSVLLAWRNSS